MILELFDIEMTRWPIDEVTAKRHQASRELPYLIADDDENVGELLKAGRRPTPNNEGLGARGAYCADPRCRW